MDPPGVVLDMTPTPTTDIEDGANHSEWQSSPSPRAHAEKKKKRKQKVKLKRPGPASRLAKEDLSQKQAAPYSTTKHARLQGGVDHDIELGVEDIGKEKELTEHSGTVHPVLANAARTMNGTFANAKHGTRTSFAAPVDRERLCNDSMNTGVMAALIGGFALGSLHEGKTDTTLSRITYLLSLVAVHACTCSCLCSAFVYFVANKLADESVQGWAAKHQILVRVPMLKFVMGCICYLTSVLLLSWHQLDNDKTSQLIALGIGGSSVLAVFVTVGLILADLPK